MRELVISKDSANQRVDKFLMKYLNEAPKGFVYKMLRKKNIKLNGKKCDGWEILAEHDKLSIYLADETIAKFSKAKAPPALSKSLDIVYEDRNILIINKPRGLLTHPDASGSQDTMLMRMLSHLYEKREYDISADSVFTPAFCNRLDMNTTGVLACAKTLDASQQLNRAISSRNTVKLYLAIVSGEIQDAGVLRGYHQKKGNTNEAVIHETGEGKEAVTEYEPLMAKNGYSLVKIRLVTGRSHQIRSHMAGIGHPVLGDRKYGKSGPIQPKYQMLHAWSISFKGLSGNLAYLNGQAFIAGKPQDFLYYENHIFN